MAYAEPHDVEVIEEYEEKEDKPLLKGIVNIPKWPIILLGVILFFYYTFWFQGEVNPNYIYGIFGGIVLFLILQSSAQEGYTSKDTAEKLARYYVKKKQREGLVPHGKLFIGYGRLVEEEPKRHLISVDVHEINGLVNHYVVGVDAKRGWNVLDFYVKPEGFYGWEHIYSS